MSLSENQAVLIRKTDLSCVLIGGNLMNMTAQESVFIKSVRGHFLTAD